MPLVLQAADPAAVHFRASPAQPVPMSVAGRRVTLQWSDPPPVLATHPVLGGYLVLHGSGKIEKILRQPGLRLRSDSIALADSLDD
jgi:hypothetical protein